MNKILQLTLLITSLFILSSCSNDSIKDDIYENDSYLNTNPINDEDNEDDDSVNNTSSEYDIDISSENNNSFLLVNIRGILAKGFGGMGN